MWVWSKLSAKKWEDAWEERFYGNANAVITEIKGGKSIRIEVYGQSQKEAAAIQEQFGGSVRELKSRDWVALSAPKREPLMIRDRLVISQVSVDPADFPGKDLIVVPPEMAFGTGDHPTTATCLRFLVDLSSAWEPPWNFLDLGTGSGVLAMAGKLLGAGEVTAFDFDAKAVEVATSNLARNRLEGVELFEGDVFSWQNERRFRLVAANLFSSVLIEALPLIENWVERQGHLLLSGILSEQWPEVRKTAARCGFSLQEERPIGKWVTACFQAG